MLFNHHASKLMAIAAITGVCAAAQVCSASLLVNGSFESGGAQNWNPSTTVTWLSGWAFTPNHSFSTEGNTADGWIWVSNSPTVVPGQDGARYLETHRYAIQTSAVDRPAATPGTEYTLDFLYTKKSTQVWDAPIAYIDFYNNNTAGNYTPLSSVQITLPNNAAGAGLWNSQFVPYSLSGIAPAGATHVAVRFNARNNQWGNVAVDNFVLTAVPEPATLGMIGMALSGFGLRRRRR